MNEDDFAYHEDQIGPRKRKCLDVVEPIDQSDINFLQKWLKNNPILIIPFQQAQQTLTL